MQSSQALQPDYAQISVTLLAEMIALQRAWASGSSINDVPRYALGLDAVSASALDRWSNGLWYISLTLALSGAFLAVLVKQWILVSQSKVCHVALVMRTTLGPYQQRIRNSQGSGSRSAV